MTKQELIILIAGKLGYDDTELATMPTVRLLDIYAMLANCTDYLVCES